MNDNNLKFVIIVLGLVIVMLVISGCAPEPQEAEVVTQIEYETVVEYEVPQVCIDFINTAKDVNQISSEFAGYTSDMLQIIIAQLQGDISMTRATEQLRDVNEDLALLNQRLGTKTGPFNQQASECEQYHG